MSKTLGRRCTNNIQMFCVYWTRDKNIIVNHVANYKETASKSSRKYEKVRGEALADQEMGPGWSINSSIMSPEINLKCTQKQPTTKKSYGGLPAPPKPPAAEFGSLRSRHIHKQIDIKIYTNKSISCVHQNNSWLRP